MTNSSAHRVTAALAIALAASTSVAHAQRRPPAPPNFDAFYELGPDSLIRRGVPKGTVKGPVTLPSQVYPGVAHDYWVRSEEHTSELQSQSNLVCRLLLEK